MSEVGSASVAIVPTFSGFRSKVSNEAEDAGKESGGRFSGAFKGAAAALVGVFAVDKLFSGLGAAVSEAANLEQSVGAINTVFKDSGAQMNAWADQAAVDVGLSKNEFNELGTLIGSQLKNGGTAMEDLAPKTKDLITLGADLSSMFGGTTADAVGALSSALKGERDPIEKFGVSLNQTKIDAEAAALGFEKVGGSLSAEANQAATLSLIMKQTADAHGNFGRETDTLAHKQQVLNAQLANGKARIGTELLPVVAAFTGILSNALGPAIDRTVSVIREVVGGFRAFGAAFKAADGDITSAGFPGFMERLAFIASRVVDTFKTLWVGFKMPSDVAASFGSNLNPLLAFGQAVRGIFDSIIFVAKTLWAGFTMPAEVAAGFGANLNPLLAFGVAVRGVVDSIVQTAKTIWAGFQMPASVAASFGANLNPFLALGQALRGILPQVVEVWTAFSPLQIVFAAVQPLLPQLVSMFGLLASTIGGALATVLTTIVPMFVQLSGVISQALGTVLAAVLPAAVQMIMILGATFSQLMPVLLPIIATIIGLATTLISQLMPIITELVSSILPPVVSIFGNILGAILPLVATIAGLLIPVISALLPVVVTVFNVVADVIKSAMQIIQGVIEVVTGIISGNWAQVWSGILNIVGGVFSLITNLVSGAIQLVLSVIINGLNAVVAFWSSAWSGIVTYLGTSIRSILDGAEGMLDDLLGFFGGIGDNVLGALGNVGTILLDSGAALIQGFIDGISGMVGAVGDAVGGVLEAAREFFPFSPAKRGPFSGKGYTSYSGKALARDFAGGIDSQTRAVAASAAGLMSAASLSINPVGAGAVGSGGMAGRGAGVTFTGPVHVRDENELARIIQTSQMDALAVYQ